MAAVVAPRQARSLLITFDAFDTLYSPRTRIALQYLRVAKKYDAHIEGEREMEITFRNAFKQELLLHPNYGKADGMTAQEWWHNVAINTFRPHLPPGEKVSRSLSGELYERFSGNHAYKLHDDVLPFLQKFKSCKLDKKWLVRETELALKRKRLSNTRIWPYTQTFVGIVSNSDDRIGSVLTSLGVPVRGVEAPSSHPSPLSSETTTKDNEPLVDFVVSSYHAGVEKPIRGIWDQAFEKARALSNKVGGSEDIEWTRIHVGDNLYKDIYGAKDAGWRALWLRRDLALKSAKTLEDENNRTIQRDKKRQGTRGTGNIKTMELYDIEIITGLDKVFKYLTLLPEVD